MKPIIDSINHEKSVNEVNVAQSNFIFFYPWQSFRKFFIYIVNWPNDCLIYLKDSLNDFSLELSRADKLAAFYIAPHAWVDFSEEGNWSTQRKSSSQVDFDQKF